MARWSTTLDDMRISSVPVRPNEVLAAYRTAASRNAVALDDGTWLQVGLLLEHATWLAPDARAEHLRRAASTVRRSIGEAAWRDGHPTDPQPPSSETTLDGRMRLYAEVIEDAGAIVIADAVLVAYLAADPSIAPLEVARVDAVRARLAWKWGDLDVASERYRRVAMEARRLRSDELRVRAWIGMAIVARLRGNFPASRAAGKRAVALARRAGLPGLESGAHHLLMVADAVAGEFAAAIDHAWHAYLCARGNATLESAALGNVGQVLLDAGHPAIARMAFRAVIRRRAPARIVLPALGGTAVAAARLGDGELLERTRLEMDACANAGAAPYDVASACLDLARAYASMHDRPRTAELQARAMQLARAHGFYEIEHHADLLMKEMAEAPPVERALPPWIETMAGALRELAAV